MPATPPLYAPPDGYVWELHENLDLVNKWNNPDPAGSINETTVVILLQTGDPGSPTDAQRLLSTFYPYNSPEAVKPPVEAVAAWYDHVQFAQVAFYRTVDGSAPPMDSGGVFIVGVPETILGIVPGAASSNGEWLCPADEYPLDGFIEEQAFQPAPQIDFRYLLCSNGVWTGSPSGGGPQYSIRLYGQVKRDFPLNTTWAAVRVVGAMWFAMPDAHPPPPGPADCCDTFGGEPLEPGGVDPITGERTPLTEEERQRRHSGFQIDWPRNEDDSRTDTDTLVLGALGGLTVPRLWDSEKLYVVGGLQQRILALPNGGYTNDLTVQYVKRPDVDPQTDLSIWFTLNVSDLNGDDPLY